MHKIIEKINLKKNGKIHKIMWKIAVISFLAWINMQLITICETGFYMFIMHNFLGLIYFHYFSKRLWPNTATILTLYQTTAMGPYSTCSLPQHSCQGRPLKPFRICLLTCYIDFSLSPIPLTFYAGFDCYLCMTLFVVCVKDTNRETY